MRASAGFEGFEARGASQASRVRQKGGQSQRKGNPPKHEGTRASRGELEKTAAGSPARAGSDHFIQVQSSKKAKKAGVGKFIAAKNRSSLASTSTYGLLVAGRG